MLSSTALASNIKFGAYLAPTASNARGTGWSSVEFDLSTHQMLIRAGFTNMRGNATAGTLRGPTAAPTTGTADSILPLPNLTGFPLGAKNGTYEHYFDMTLASNYNPSFLTANGGSVPTAFDTLVAALTEQKVYLNIASSQFSGGELRGFFKVVPPVPEPAALATGAVLICVRRRR